MLATKQSENRLQESADRKILVVAAFECAFLLLYGFLLFRISYELIVVYIFQKTSKSAKKWVK